MEPKVKEYIDKQNPLEKKILMSVRKIILNTLASVDEQMAWGAITFSGKRFYLAVVNGKIHVGFAVNGLNEEEMSRFEGKGNTMRHIKIRSLDDIDEKQLVSLIKLVEQKSMCSDCH